MTNIGKFSGIALAIIAVFLSADAFLANMPGADKVEPATDYTALFNATEDMSLSLANERLLTITSYSIDGPAPAEFIKGIQADRSRIRSAFEAVSAFEAEKEAPHSDRIAAATLMHRAKLMEDFQRAFEQYGSQQAEIDADLAVAAGEFKNLSSRGLARSFDTLSDNLLQIQRFILFATPSETLDAATALQLRHNLLLMQESSTREASNLAKSVAAKSPIYSLTKDSGSQFSGQVHSAWNNVQATARSGIFGARIIENLDKVSVKYFGGFLDAKFELYDLSDVALEDAAISDDDIIVDYEQGPEDWVKTHSSAIAPLLNMIAQIRTMEPKTEPAPEPNQVPVSAALLLISIILGAAFIGSLFMRPTTTALNQTSGQAVRDSKLAEIQHLAGRISQLSDSSLR